MTEPTDPTPPPNRAANTNETDDTMLGDLARKAFADRRRREQVPGLAGLFGEPAWDILLELFIAAREGRSLARAELSAGASLPDTVGHRWIAILERRGLVVGDDRHLALSAETCAGLADYFRKS